MRVNILGTDVKLKKHKNKKKCPRHLRDCMGAYRASKNTIYLNPWCMKGRREEFNTLMHEVLHTIDSMTADPGSRLRHRDVYRISKGLESFFFNNKKLVLGMLGK